MSKNIPISLPSPARKGGLIAASYISKLREAIDRLSRARDSRDRFMPNGTPPLPFTLFHGSDNAKWTVISGTVNGVIPTLDSVALDNAEPPEITVSATTYVWLKVEADFLDAPEDWLYTVVYTTTAGTPAGTTITATNFISYLYLGSIVLDNATESFDSSQSYSGGNLRVDSFGSVNFWWKA